MKTPALYDSSDEMKKVKPPEERARKSLKKGRRGRTRQYVTASIVQCLGDLCLSQNVSSQSRDTTRLGGWLAGGRVYGRQIIE